MYVYVYLSNSDASNFHEVLGSLNSTEYLSSNAYKNKEKGIEREGEGERHMLLIVLFMSYHCNICFHLPSSCVSIIDNYRGPPFPHRLCSCNKKYKLCSLREDYNTNPVKRTLCNQLKKDYDTNLVKRTYLWLDYVHD